MSKDILTKIVEHKKIEVEQAIAKVPIEVLREKAAAAPQPKGFYDALSKPGPEGVNIICEIKRASPSKGMIKEDLDPAAYAKMYENGGGAAISVLTDNAFFKGSMDDLTTARSASRLPILRKEFIISEYQIFEARAAGADAVLLIVRILTPHELESLLRVCEEAGLDALVEIHGEEEVKVAKQAGAKLVGINNRNLKTFETNISIAGNMARLLEPWQAPVAASGISTREDIEKSLEAGIFNFLIGESLVRAGDTVGFLNELVKGSLKEKA